MEELPLLLQKPETFATAIAEKFVLLLEKEELKKKAKEQTASVSKKNPEVDLESKIQLLADSIRKKIENVRIKTEVPPPEKASKKKEEPKPILGTERVLKKKEEIPPPLPKETPKTELIEDKPAIPEVIVGSFAEKALTQLFKRESDVKIQKTKTDEELPDTDESIGGLGGLLSILLGSAVTGLMSSGPEKGLLKMIAKVIGTKVEKMIGPLFKAIESPLKQFYDKVLKLILKPLSTVGTWLKPIFSKIGGVVTKVLPKATGIVGNLFSKIGGKLLTVLKGAVPFLKKIPVIGTIISVGFAISRFMKGDTTGGVIDVLSALAGLLHLIPGPGTAAAIALQIGLDGLNAFLDFKYGGSSKEASGKKWEGIKDFFGSIGNWITEKLKNAWDSISQWGPIKTLIDLSSAMMEGGMGFIRLLNPMLGSTLDWMWDQFNGLVGIETPVQETTSAKPIKSLGETIKEFLQKIKDSLYDIPVLGDFIRAAEKGEYLEAIKTLIPSLEDVKEWGADAISQTTGFAKKGWNKVKGIFGGAEKQQVEAAEPELKENKRPSETAPTPTETPELNVPAPEVNVKVVPPEPTIIEPALPAPDPTWKDIAKNTADTTSSIAIMTHVLQKATREMIKAMQQINSGGNVTIANQGTSPFIPSAVDYAHNYKSPIRDMRANFLR